MGVNWGQILNPFKKSAVLSKKIRKNGHFCPFLWSRKRESNPPESAWEADAIPLGDSCIKMIKLFASRFPGKVEPAPAARCSACLRNDPPKSAWETDATLHLPKRLKQDFWQRGAASATGGRLRGRKCQGPELCRDETGDSCNGYFIITDGGISVKHNFAAFRENFAAVLRSVPVSRAQTACLIFAFMIYFSP